MRIGNWYRDRGSLNRQESFGRKVTVTISYCARINCFRAMNVCTSVLHSYCICLSTS